ncbi:MAG TPA: hypothetical protein VIY47_01435 [Ignavibacteriaceae bacterium]
MSQNIYILSSPNHRTIAKLLDEQIVSNGIFESEDLVLTQSVLIDMAKSCLIDFFYVIIADREVLFPNFDFSYKPPYWDSLYVHIWDNDTRIRLFNKKEVLKNPSMYTDESLKSGKIRLKNIEKKISELPIYDIIFLSYNEFFADENFKKLKERWPRAKRSHGVAGIREAHRAAAKLATTSMFYVVDADAEIVPTFNFDRQPSILHSASVCVWYSRNPINNLEYGYGGVKLFYRQAVLDYTEPYVDFTTSISDRVAVIPEISNITRIDTDPFSAWKSAFRECVKLSSKVINGQLDKETDERLHIWCSVGNGEFGDFSIDGANEGAFFGRTYFDQPDMLRLINDFGWLEKKFNS